MDFKQNFRNAGRRALALAAMGGIVMLAAARPAQAQRAWDVGLRVGYFADAEAITFGLGVWKPLTADGEGFYFNPNVEFGSGDVYNIGALNADFQYDFFADDNLGVWIGAGPALLIIDPEGPENDNEVDPALNVILGAGRNHGSWRPFVQGKGILADNSELNLAVGLRF